MKSFFTFVAAFLLSLSAAAQSGQGFLNFSYQAVIRNSSGALITNRAIAMRVTLLQGSATGTAVYVETHAPTTNANGLATLAVGGGTPVSGNFFTIIWSSPGGYFLKTEIDPLGGTNYTIAGTTQLLSVPYAMFAQVAAQVQGHYIGELFGGGIIFSVWHDHRGAEHGLIASLDDLGNGSSWAVPAIASTTIGNSFDDGATNTTAIVAQGAGGSSAAGLCDAYTDGVYSDWYLPAVWELNMLYNQAVAVNQVLANDNNPLSNVLGQNGFKRYWSSTRSVDTRPSPGLPTAHAIYFKSFGAFSSTNDQSQETGQVEFRAQDGSPAAVRAVRRF